MNWRTCSFLVIACFADVRWQRERNRFACLASASYLVRSSTCKRITPLVEALREAFPFERGMAFYYFERGGKMRQLVHAIKYKGHKKAGYWIARHVARELMAIQSDFTQFDYLVPVPLHRDKQRERGFNQSEWIARGLQSVWGTPIDTTSLVRARATESQTHKTPLERWQNVCAVFKVSKDSPLAGKRVLLVDDVCTTGSTFLACAHALNALPDVRVSFLSLAGA